MFTFIDLFAGIGGFRLPLENLGGKCLFSSEINKHSIKTYMANFNDKPSGDIKKIKESDIPSHDLLVAGFPCQSFSIAGKQKGFDDDRGELFFDILRIAKYHRPKVLFLENVRNFAIHDSGNTLKTIINLLNKLNYSTYYKVINSKKFGLPQNRERIYIVSFNRDYKYKDFRFPEGENQSVVVSDILEKNILNEDKYIINRKDINYNEKNLKIHEESNRINKVLRLATINKGGQGDRVYSSKGIGITLSASAGGSGAKTGAYYVDGKIRKLTPREAARMQGFPDSFKIPVSDNQAWTQFGNTVPINVVYEIMKNIIKTCIFEDKI